MTLGEHREIRWPRVERRTDGAASFAIGSMARGAMLLVYGLSRGHVAQAAQFSHEHWSVHCLIRLFQFLKAPLPHYGTLALRWRPEAWQAGPHLQVRADIAVRVQGYSKR